MNDEVFTLTYQNALQSMIQQLDMIFTLQAKVKLLERDNAALRAEKEKANGEQSEPTEI